MRPPKVIIKSIVAASKLRKNIDFMREKKTNENVQFTYFIIKSYSPTINYGHADITKVPERDNMATSYINIYVQCVSTLTRIKCANR